MNSMVLNLLLFGLIYTIILCVIFIHRSRKNRRNNDSDDEGGLPIINPPTLDLPPGICLPDGPSGSVKEKDEVLV